MRACHSADRTGHMILQTLYQQCIKQGVTFFDEFHMLDLLLEEGECRGVVALEIATGELHTFHAKAVLIATGGFGRMFKVSSNAFALTGERYLSLDEALDDLGKRRYIDGAFKAAYAGLFGFTGSQRRTTIDDARLILVMCASLVGYLAAFDTSALR